MLSGFTAVCLQTALAVADALCVGDRCVLVQARRTEVDRPFFLLRLEGYCSLESISQIIGQLGLPFLRSGIFRNGSRRTRRHCRKMG